MKRLWTVPRAITVGVGAGVAAMAAWIALQSWPQAMIFPYVGALALTALCGLYVLLATYYDYHRNPRRGVRIRPIRGFDIVAGLVLAVPSLWALRPFLALL